MMGVYRTSSDACTRAVDRGTCRALLAVGRTYFVERSRVDVEADVFVLWYNHYIELPEPPVHKLSFLSHHQL